MLNSYSYQEHSSSSHEEFLKKTIEIKNKNIDELLKELKETKDIYQEYKSSYLNEEKKMKSKIIELSTQISQQGAQIQKLKLINNKLKGDLQYQSQKQRKIIQNQSQNIKELTSNLQQSESKYKAQYSEHQKLKEKYSNIQEKHSKMEQKLKNKGVELGIYETEMRKVREEFLLKQRKIEEQNARLKETIRSFQVRKIYKNKMNCKLDELQNKIKDNMRKI